MTTATSGYIDLTFRVYPESDQYVGECVELGVASCGDSVEEAARAAIEATTLYLQEIEETGERERTFRECGIQVKPGEPPEVPTERLLRLQPNEFVTSQRLTIPVTVAA